MRSLHVGTDHNKVCLYVLRVIQVEASALQSCCSRRGNPTFRAESSCRCPLFFKPGLCCHFFTTFERPEQAASLCLLAASQCLFMHQLTCLRVKMKGRLFFKTCCFHRRKPFSVSHILSRSRLGTWRKPSFSPCFSSCPGVNNPLCVHTYDAWYLRACMIWGRAHRPLRQVALTHCTSSSFPLLLFPRTLFFLFQTKPTFQYHIW